MRFVRFWPRRAESIHLARSAHRSLPLKPVGVATEYRVSWELLSQGEAPASPDPVGDKALAAGLKR